MNTNFHQYHSDNPHVYDKILELSHRARAAGRKEYSMRAIFHLLRWHYNVETQGDEFKINNNYSQDYALKVMEENPELRGFFKMRF